MKIHFCDLCNESVPQTDLDEGRAFLRKGRVICLTCDRSMSHPEEGGGPGSAATPPDGASPAGPFGGGPAGSDEMQGGASGAPTAPLQPTGTWGTAPHQSLHAQRARGGGPGLGLAFLAILLIGAVGFWLHDRIEKLDRLVAAEAQETLQEQRLSERRTEQGLQRLGDETAALEARIQQELRDQRGNVDGRLRASQEEGRALAEKVDAFGGRIEVMKASFDEVSRHDLELMRLQQKFTSLSDQVVQMGIEFDQLSNRVTSAAAASIGIAAGDSGEAPPPAWIGLVEQLSSANPSDRWQAVFALRETEDPAVSEYLVPILEDEDLFIRMATATALGELGSPVAIPALIDALEDDESAVRLEAYTALKALTKRDLPFDPMTEDTAARSRRVKAWRDWWEKEREKYEG